MSEGSPIIVSQKSIKEFKAPEWMQASEKTRTGSVRLRKTSNIWDMKEEVGVESNVELKRNNFSSRSLRIPKEGVAINSTTTTNERTGSSQNLHITPGLGNIPIQRSNSTFEHAHQPVQPQIIYTSDPYYQPQPLVTDARSINGRQFYTQPRVIPIEIEQPQLVQFEPQCYYIKQPAPIQYITHEQPAYSQVIQQQMPRSQSASNVNQYITRDGAHVTETHEIVPNHDGTEEIEIRKRTIKRKNNVAGGESSCPMTPRADRQPVINISTANMTNASGPSNAPTANNQELISMLQDLINSYKDQAESARPIRTHSQTNILTQPARIANNWTSETNIRANVGKTGYSAHRENAQHEAMSQAQARESYTEVEINEQLTRNIGDGKYYEELEVITLQPIGKGVQDLQAGTFVSTLPRSTEMTPNPSNTQSLNNLVEINAGVTNQMSSRVMYNNQVQQKQAMTMNNNFQRSMSFNTGLQRTQATNGVSRPFIGNTNSSGISMTKNAGATMSGINMNGIGGASLSQNRGQTMNGGTSGGFTRNGATRNSVSSISTMNRIQYVKGIAPSLSVDERNNLRNDGFRSGQQSPSISNYNRQKFSYESNTDIRSRMGTGKNFVSPQISVSNANQQHSSMFSAGGAMGHTEGQFMDSETGLRHSLDTQNIWYRPNCSREEVIDMLRGEEAGRFIIRKSTTFSNSYGLALKVNKLEPRMMNKIDDASSELVRHFLIESVDGGVHLRGFADEQVFKSLAHFVHHHTVQKDALPCRLRLPQSIRSTGGIEVSNTGAVSSGIGGGSYSLNRTGSIGSREFQTSYIRANSQIERLDRNRGIKFDIGYLGHVVVDRLCEDAAARRGTTEVLTQYEQSHLPKKCIATIEAIPGDGIYINDFSRRGLVKKFIKASDVEWIGYDPEVRTYTDKNLSNLSDARIIVIVAQKQKLILHENSAYVLCELNSANSNSIITYIRNNFVSASRD